MGTSQLYDLGFSIPDDEVQLYKQSVLQAGSIEDVIPDADSGFTQWVADNADHQTSTIDGKNTFHGMGTIAATTCKANNVVPPLPPVKREQRVAVADLTKDKGVPITPFTGC